MVDRVDMGLIDVIVESVSQSMVPRIVARIVFVSARPDFENIF